MYVNEHIFNANTDFWIYLYTEDISKHYLSEKENIFFEKIEGSLEYLISNIDSVLKNGVFVKYKNKNNYYMIMEIENSTVITVNKTSLIYQYYFDANI